MQEIYRETVIYTKGCIPSGESWLETNLIPVAAVAVGIAVLQVSQSIVFHAMSESKKMHNTIKAIVVGQTIIAKSGHPLADSIG